MKNFALIGAAGYIAPRHMQAIKDTGGDLLAALDPNDSVGIMDSFFPKAEFFTEFERFDRHLDKLARLSNKQQIDYVSICSPNYLHDSHARFSLRAGADAICEKPLVLNPWNIDGLLEIERLTSRKVYTILQLRVHPAIEKLRTRIATGVKDKKYEVELTYITSRGSWYMQSWKGDAKKSGGIATNIGIHFFDMLYYVFGKLDISRLHYLSDKKAAGFLEFKNARVRWFLSIDECDLQKTYVEVNKKTFRSLVIDGEEIEFSDGFTELHTTSYKQILSGGGFGLEENRTAIELVSRLRNAEISQGSCGEEHPLYSKLND